MRALSIARYRPSSEPHLGTTGSVARRSPRIAGDGDQPDLGPERLEPGGGFGGRGQRRGGVEHDDVDPLPRGVCPDVTADGMDGHLATALRQQR